MQHVCGRDAVIRFCSGDFSNEGGLEEAER